MDTPGILARADEERNPMEGLTLAAVEHLPSAVVFVMDLSGTSGKLSAPLDQLEVREQVRVFGWHFPRLVKSHMSEISGASSQSVSICGYT